MKAISTIGLLILSNTFMTIAWYGHLKFHEWKGFAKLGLFAVIALSWGLAFFEYCFQVPANRMGFKENGGPFTIWQLKIIQEAISLIVFSGFTIIVFRNERGAVRILSCFPINLSNT
ncbi:MAG: DMT family protein [Rubrivivax sp.]